ncbi:hypothetical protein V1281_000148 [Nitrobacteraceae bacterium AZCC 2161]|jgi:hypothetical protein
MQSDSLGRTITSTNYYANHAELLSRQYERRFQTFISILFR